MWIANLSNGKILAEKEHQPEKPTPWRELLEYCRKSGVKITGLRLTDNQRTMISAMPHQMCDGYFQAYEATRYMFSGAERTKQGIGSVVGDSVFITWMGPADNNLTYIWTEVRPLSECLQHISKKV